MATILHSVRVCPQLILESGRTCSRETLSPLPDPGIHHTHAQTRTPPWICRRHARPGAYALHTRRRTPRCISPTHVQTRTPWCVRCAHAQTRTPQWICHTRVDMRTPVDIPCIHAGTQPQCMCCAHVQTCTPWCIRPTHMQTRTPQWICHAHAQTHTPRCICCAHTQTRTLWWIHHTHVQTRIPRCICPTHVQTHTPQWICRAHAQTRTPAGSGQARQLWALGTSSLRPACRMHSSGRLMQSLVLQVVQLTLTSWKRTDLLAGEEGIIVNIDIEHKASTVHLAYLQPRPRTRLLYFTHYRHTVQTC